MDFSQVESVIGLASAAVGLTDKAASTASVIKKLFASGKDADVGESEKLLSSLSSELTAANLMNVQLSGALKDLSAELRREDEFQKQKARYELFKTQEGDIVYRLRADMKNGQPDHFICPVCLNKDNLVIFITGEGDYKICQSHREHTFRFSNHPPPRVRRDDYSVW